MTGDEPWLNVTGLAFRSFVGLRATSQRKEWSEDVCYLQIVKNIKSQTTKLNQSFLWDVARKPTKLRKASPVTL